VTATKKPIATKAKGNVHRNVRATLGACPALWASLSGPETIGQEV
jgi:hypothetical protein